MSSKFSTKRVLRILVFALRAITPVRRHVVVHGWPDLEGNALETVKALLRMQQNTVYWLVESSSRHELLEYLPDTPLTALRVVRRKTLRGLWVYVSASCTFYTHGLFFSPPPSRRKPIVNLWHGDGPKKNGSAGHLTPLSTYVVSSTLLFGTNKCRSFGVPDTGLLLSGNPRCEQFNAPAKDADLRALGLDPEQPILVVMPTYRAARAIGTHGAFTDTVKNPILVNDNPSAAIAISIAVKMGWQVVIKPHPADADTFRGSGARVVTEDHLRAAKTTAYALLARSRALLTDYSSVWTDYLILDKPIGFVIDDYDEYRRGRGLDIDDLDRILPGPAIKNEADATNFLMTAIDDAADLRGLRSRSASAIGLNPTKSPAQELVRELRLRGVLT